MDPFDGLADDPELLAQVGRTLPARPLVVDGLPRHPNREVTVDQALAFSSRGMRSFLLSFDVCCELSDEEFRRIIRAERDVLDDHETDEGMEADLLLYGRNRADGDTRLLAVVLARHVQGHGATG